MHSNKPITIGPRYTLIGGTPWTMPNVGESIDTMAGAYQQFLNRKTKLEGDAAKKDFTTACKDLVDKLPSVYDILYAQMNMPSPPINRKLRASLEASVEQHQFHFRWLNFVQLTQHFTAREHLNTIEKKVAKVELIYEMYWLAKDLLEIIELVPTEPEEIN